MPVARIDVAVAQVTDASRARRVRRATAAHAAAAMAGGAVPVIATSRDLVPPSADDPTGLRLARRVSRLLAAVVRDLEPTPAWILAKGGITSSDLAATGLGAREATVVGPLLPGVPVWRLPRPGGGEVLLVVFPGNVGDDAALRSAVATMAASGAPRAAARAPAVRRSGGGTVRRSSGAPRAAAS